MWMDSRMPARFSLLDRVGGPRLLDDVFQTLVSGGLTSVGPSRFTVHQGDDAVLLTAELPGMTQADLSLSVEGRTLRIEGERKDELPEGFRVLRRERAPLRFAQQFSLGEKLDADGIEAVLENGLLRVRIPHRAEAKPRTIEVKGPQD